jgi:bis(5'-nucleosidyl)-tetraphosphatase
MQNLSSIHKILFSGLVVLHHDGSRYRFLVLRMFSEWDFPKTLVEHGEDALAAAIRETREATGIDELELNWADEYRETVPHEDGSVSRYYLAESRTMEVELRIPAGGEDDFEFRWVTADEAEDILPPRLDLVLNFAVRMLVSGARSGVVTGKDQNP